MKKLIILLLTLVLLTACGSGEKKEVLHIFNWGAYIDESTITTFEKEYNVKVNYSRFASNEEMYHKITNTGGFDLVIPSDYTVQRLREEGLLQEIDYTKLSNYGNVLDSLKGRKMDPEDKYSVPYFWGNVGLVYNKENVSISDLDAKGWDILNDTRYKGSIYFYNSERDAFMIALKTLGYSMNSSDPKELQEANDWLIAMKSLTAPTYATDEAIDRMVAGEKDIAVMYSGDANYIISENEDMDFYVPKQGTNTWLDSMVIPTTANNPDLAHKWIDFTLRPEIALLNTEEVGYTSPIQSVIDEITGPGGTYEGMESYIPRTGYELDEEFIFDQKLKEQMNQYWEKIIAQ